MKSSIFGAYLLVFRFLPFLLLCLDARLRACRSSGKIGGIKPPPGQCNPESDLDCCKQGKMYTNYKCSPALPKGGDGGGPSECDHQYHSMILRLLPLSTGGYSGGDWCLNYITIVVDECDSTMGCDKEHDYRPPCPNNIVDTSKEVWKSLGIPEGDRGKYDIT
ncbi:unnamed protein product [Withania somnifera]